MNILYKLHFIKLRWRQPVIYLIFFVLAHAFIYSQLHYETSYDSRQNEGNLASMYTFRQMADFKLLKKKDTPSTFDPKKVYEGAVVLVQANLLKDFFCHYHPKIKNRYILLTHHSDASAPGEKYEQFLEDPKIIAWLARNPSTLHPKLFPIPIGVRNRTAKGNFPIANVKNWRLYKKHLLYFNFKVRKNTDRELLYHLFKNTDFCYISPRKPHTNYLIDIAKSYFVLSPRGHGLDCFRTYEALVLGAIPIVKSSPLDPLFKDLPVLIVDDWKEITEDFLYQKYEEMEAQSFCLDVLYIDYWKDFVHNLRLSAGIERYY